MTEQDWLRSREPELMVTALSDHMKRAKTKEGRRRLRLFGCACCRRVVHLFPDEPFGSVVGLAEQFADGTASQSELDAALGGADPVRRGGEAEHIWQARNSLRVAVGTLREPAANAAGASFWIRTALRRLRADEAAEAAVQADLVRCIFGNPFRPPPPIAASLLTSNECLIKRLAEQAYENRVMPAGTLDPARLAVLADALEEAGADDVLAAHLREPGPHYRGCHVVDLLTGRK